MRTSFWEVWREVVDCTRKCAAAHAGYETESKREIGNGIYQKSVNVSICIEIVQQRTIGNKPSGRVPKIYRLESTIPVSHEHRQVRAISIAAHNISFTVAVEVQCVDSNCEITRP